MANRLHLEGNSETKEDAAKYSNRLGLKLAIHSRGTFLQSSLNADTWIKLIDLSIY
jgi:hypothetical protein